MVGVLHADMNQVVVRAGEVVPAEHLGERGDVPLE